MKMENDTRLFTLYVAYKGRCFRNGAHPPYDFATWRRLYAWWALESDAV
ncbi:TPA: hypothetical protein QDA99_006617 [Burkholderia vietnamiensis]|nr:hypothetical protein [Burkholderia vietnamiensis]HDR9003020.1 hypothetical protein [Burkholderia vietnamiensis]HDR9006936.1 hypothetical protein [Burkholderia vietnamiensis]